MQTEEGSAKIELGEISPFVAKQQIEPKCAARKNLARRFARTIKEKSPSAR
jgi:hypothetical protein